MEIAIADDIDKKAEQYGGELRGGIVDRQWLLTGEAADGLTFRFYRSRYREGEEAFESPRHHHAFQQLRWAESGSINYGPGQDIPEGDLCYFPKGAWYGPQRKDHGSSFLLQFGMGDEMPGVDAAAKMSGAGSAEEQALRAERLKGRGAVVDPGDAKPERNPKRPPAPERFAAPILLHPGNFAYHLAAPGVEIKHMGRFYDQPGPNGDLRLSMIRLSEGADYRFDAERAQLAWSTKPGLRIDGRAYPKTTCLYSPRDEEALIAVEGELELYLVEFPRID